jgi:hypothetical protein
MSNIYEMKRNDVDAATEWAREAMAAGKYTPEAAHVLIMLQDEPGELVRRLNAMIEAGETDE